MSIKEISLTGRHMQADEFSRSLLCRGFRARRKEQGNPEKRDQITTGMMTAWIPRAAAKGREAR